MAALTPYRRRRENKEHRGKTLGFKIHFECDPSLLAGKFSQEVVLNSLVFGILFYVYYICLLDKDLDCELVHDE